MLTTAEATEAIAAAMPAFGTTEIELSRATGRILHQSVSAERDQPPFDRVTMDGIAIRYASFDAGNRQYKIQGRQHAGEPRQSLTNDNACIEIMTGAVLPDNTDCVVPVERTIVEDSTVTIETDYAARQHQFIHPQASDHKKGQQIIAAGHRIEAVDIAIIASCGLSSVQVSEQPKIRVISTGNELVAAGSPINDYQIRSSNGPALVAMLETHGYTQCQHDHLLDDVKLLEQSLAQHLQEANVLILSGGVSMGKADFVPDVLAQLGVEVVFHKISQRPGKPMWFGIGSDGQAVFALPGNPVSSLLTCLVVVRPALGVLQGRGEVPAPVYRHAEAEFNIDAGQRREYLRVRRVRLRPGDLPSQPMRVELAPSQNSGVLTSCQWADALAIVEPGQKIREGDWVKYLPMDYLMLAP